MKENSHNPPLLEARKVSFRFPDASKALFRPVDFTLEEGDRLALLGPTGSGKSVLLKILAGLLVPTSGEILFRGRALRRMRASEWREFRRSLGMTFQKDGLFDSLTCGDNLRFPLWEVERLSGKAADARVEAALESVDLKGQKELKVFEMSGGMQKRLGIARALLFRPQVVLYDEPTAGLDPITSRNILELLSQQPNAEGKSTVLIVSSQPDQVEPLTSSAAFLHGEHLDPAKSWAKCRAEKHTALAQFLSGSLEGPLTEEWSEAPL